MLVKHRLGQEWLTKQNGVSALVALVLEQRERDTIKKIKQDDVTLHGLQKN